MKTLLKVSLLVALILAVWLLWPSLVVPLTVIAVLAGLAGAALLGVVAAVASVGIAVLGTLLAVAAVVVLGLSPLWIPVLLVVGLVKLCRRSSSAPATPVAA